MLCFALYSCTDSDSGNEAEPTATPNASAASEDLVDLNFQAAASGLKQITFTWSSVPDATHYEILENHDGRSGYTPIATSLSADTVNFTHDVAILKSINASYLLRSCNVTNCVESAEIYFDSAILNPAIGYLKASNTGHNDAFASAISISDNGQTLAIGAPLESSNGQGVNSDESNNFSFASGAVYVFHHDGQAWQQQAYIKANNADALDYFGSRLSLSADGNTLAIAALGEDSGTTGINSTPNNQEDDSGAVYVYSRVGNVWSQQAYIKANNTDENDGFGSSVSLDNSGTVLAIGAYQEDSNAQGVNGASSNNNASNSGAVYLFNFDGNHWAQTAYVKASYSEANDWFGYALSLSGDGNTLAVGAYREDSAATGINGHELNNNSRNSGAVYLFRYASNSWQQQAYIKAHTQNGDDRFGYSLSIDDTGNTLAVGAYREDSAASGINADANDNLASDSGAAYVFEYANNAWQQTAYLKASNADIADNFGSAVSISGDGATIAVGAPNENSAAQGVTDQQTDNQHANSGAAYVFSLNAGIWQQTAYLKASNTDSDDQFANSVTLDQNGRVLAIGAVAEASNATGINGDQANNNASASGAVYLY